MACKGCGHEEYEHEAVGGCQYYLNHLKKYCPCTGYEEAGA